MCPTPVFDQGGFVWEYYAFPAGDDHRAYCPFMGYNLRWWGSHLPGQDRLRDWVYGLSNGDKKLLGVLLRDSSNCGGARLECDALYDFVMEREGEPWFRMCLRWGMVWRDSP